jgi:hypothetical protein
VRRQLDTILPGDTIAYPFLWPDSLVSGRYHVVVRATGGPRTVSETADLELGTALHGTKNPTIPSGGGLPGWLFALLGLTLLVVALVVALWSRRRRAARRARSGGGPDDPPGGVPAVPEPEGHGRPVLRAVDPPSLVRVGAPAHHVLSGGPRDDGTGTEASRDATPRTIRWTAD